MDADHEVLFIRNIGVISKTSIQGPHTRRRGTSEYRLDQICKSFSENQRCCMILDEAARKLQVQGVPKLTDAHTPA